LLGPGLTGFKGVDEENTAGLEDREACDSSTEDLEERVLL